MKILLGSKSKINNPIDNTDNTYSFEGEFNSEMFSNNELPQYSYLKNQNVNFENVKTILDLTESRFEYIWLGCFDNYQGHKCINFVIRSNIGNDNRQIFWHKYITKAPGSGQNWIYIIENNEKRKEKLTSWITNIGYPNQEI